MESRYQILAIIPARGGSKGVPRKALQKLGDCPLIAYTIRDALKIRGISKVFVTTDDPEIRDVSVRYGAEVPFLRPDALALDDSDLADAISYSKHWYREYENFMPDIHIVMSPTHPFRRPNLINDALQKGIEQKEIFNIGSIAPVTVPVDNYWTYINERLVPFGYDGHCSEVSGSVYQLAFSFNIVFDCRSDRIGPRIPVILNEIESIDIDEPADLELARMIVADKFYPFDHAGEHAD